MLSALNQRLLRFAKEKVKPVYCPECGKQFQPFAHQEIGSWSDFVGPVACPHCHHSYSLEDGKRLRARGNGESSVPLERPAGSRIERKEISERELLFYTPPRGTWGFEGFFAFFWNGFMLIFTCAFVAASLSGKRVEWTPLLIIVPFIAIGVGMAYWALLGRFATHLLFLGPGFVRLQRELFGRRKTRDLLTEEIDRVELKEFYRQNNRTIYGIEIGAGKEKLRFGSTLSTEEKDWLCAEIRTFLRDVGNVRLDEGEGDDEAAKRIAVSPEGAELPMTSKVVREDRSADEIVYHVKPSGRWGFWLVAALFVGGTCGAMLSQVAPELWKTIEAAGDGPSLFVTVGMLVSGIGFLVTSFGTLVGLGLLYGAIRNRYLTHRVTLTPEAVRLESILFRNVSRSIPLREVRNVELYTCMESNGKPVYAIRVIGEHGMLQFGYRLNDEEKLWLASEIEGFVQGRAPVAQSS